MKATLLKTVFTLFVFLIFSSLSAQIQSVNCEKAKLIVEQTMIPYLKSIPSNIVKYYGIKDTSEITTATIGDPIPVYYLDHDTLLFSKTWRVPLVINHEFRALFTVLSDNGNYSIVDFGATVLAKDIQEYTQENNILGIFRVFPLQKDFFILQNENSELIFDPIPLISNQKCTLNTILNSIKF